MNQLNSLDQQFLAVEDATHTGHVAGVYLLEPPAGAPVTREALCALVAERLHLLEPLRRKLLAVPLGLDRPYWVEDSALRVEAHVTEHRLPDPGGDAELAALVAGLHAQALDRSRPLWELHLIHDLAGNRQAVYGKVHHAAVDGVSGAALLGALLDRNPAPTPMAAPAGAPTPAAPRRRDLFRRGLANALAQPGRSLRAVPRLLPHLDHLPGANRIPGSAAVAAAAARIAGRHARGDSDPAPVPRRRLRVPQTPFNAAISARRAVAWGSVPVLEIRALRTAFGCSDNDVVLAICAGLLRRWLLEHGALPAAPLVIGVPVSMRPSGAKQDSATTTRAGGNRISLMIAPLPTDLAEAGERVVAVAEAMLAAKRRLTSMPETWLTDMTDLVPAALMGVTTRGLGRLVHRGGGGRHPVNLVISHVPGPHIPLYLAGARMSAHYPISAISDALGGLNITVVGHDGDLDFGFVACPDLVPDLWEVARALPDVLAELTSAAAAAAAASLASDEP